MKVLFIDINIQYTNPTRNYIPNLLEYNCDVTYYGPGYVSNNVLENGIENFFRDSYEFDFIIATEKIIFFDGCFKKACFGNHFHMFKIDYELYNRYMREIQSFFYNVRKDKKILFLLETDYYCLDDTFHMKALKELDCYYVGFGRQFLKFKEELEDLKNETFAIKANDNWIKFVEENDDKIISFPGMVCDSEFSYNDLTHRFSVCEIPGTQYFFRKEANRFIEKSRYKASFKIYNKFYSLLKKFHFSVFGNKYLLKLYNIIFSHRIEKSRYTYTCGSGLQWPIRKFFEVPALGSLLICKPCNGFEELGFKDGINCICSSPNELLNTLNFLENNLEKAQRIAKKGRELVLKKHSVHARTLQFYKVLEAIKNKSFKGTYWENGEFYVK